VARADKDYDCEINYHPSKANVVANALSRKSLVELVALGISQPQLIKELIGMGLEVVGEGMLIGVKYCILDPP
jgi:hypothetical protein